MTATPTPTAAPPRPGLRSRNFVLLWASQASCLFGSASSATVLPLLAATSFAASPLWMGSLTAAVWAPWLLFGVLAGLLVDRNPPRRVTIAANLVGAGCVAVVPIAWAVDRLSLPLIVLAAFGGGTAAVFVQTSVGPLTVHTVPHAELDRANGALIGANSAMTMAGPGVGGALLRILSAPLVVLLESLSYLVSALCMLLMRLPEHDQIPRSGGLRGQALAAARLVWQDRFLRYFLIVGGLSNFGLTGYQALLVLFALREVDLSAATVALFIAVGSAGGVLGALVATRLGRRLGTARGTRWLTVASGVAPLPILLAEPGWRAVVVPVALALLGASVVAGNVLRNTFRQRWVPAAILGRVSGFTSLLLFGTMPVAALLAGLMGELIGLRSTMTMMMAINTVATVTVLVPRLSPLARLRDYPSPEAP